MIALICLLIPPLALVLVREKLNNGQISIKKSIMKYLLWVLILNVLMMLILYFGFDIYGNLFSKLNKDYIFAIKYFALSFVLALTGGFARSILARLPKLPKLVHKPVKVSIFLIIISIVFLVLNYIVQPIWILWNNYDTTNGFYEEPENTIETIFIGSSVTINSITPMELYENYGICAYNLGTEQQPMLASYYWAEEAYRLHSETLNTIVLDVSMLRKTPEEAYYHKALDNMEFSEVKYQAVKDYSEIFDEETFINLIPLLSYHDRWKELTEEDFTKSKNTVDVSSRGYNFVTETRIDSEDDYTSIPFPLVVINENNDEAEFDTEALYYFKKLVLFCEEHDIKLVLTKVTTTGWGAKAHLAAQKIADDYELDFFDFNYDPYLSEIDFNYSYDTVDTHMNYYGATKYTEWFGNYLINECGNHDIRGDEKYSFMETELEEYHRNIEKISLNTITDPTEYISYLLNQGDYTIFISVMNSASGKLTQEQRDYFASIGLTKLSELTYHASYIAVIENGTVIVEQLEEDPSESEDNDETVINDMENIEEIFEEKLLAGTLNEEEESLLLTYSGVLSDGTKFEISSGGKNLGNESSILIDGTEYSENSQGLNIVVYDNKRQEIIDQTVFDTQESSERGTLDYEERLKEIKESGSSLSELSGIDRELYLYDRAAAQDKLVKELNAEIEEDDLLKYLEAFWNEDGCEIFISVKEDAADALTDDVRAALDKLGLTELANIKSGDSYLAIVRNGEVVTEETDHGEVPIEMNSYYYSLVSGGKDSGNTSSIMVNGTECSKGKKGINIVIYDIERGEVVDQVVFDTSMVEQKLNQTME